MYPALCKRILEEAEVLDSTGVLVFNGGSVAYGDDGFDGPRSILYNLTSEVAQPGWNKLAINYSIPGTGVCSVSTTLDKVARDGAQTALCTVTSDPDQAFNNCYFSNTKIDFSRNAYYVEVVLYRENNNCWPQINYLRVADY
jgi:hypothetical protein